jgi:hypothetical protein
LRIGNGFGRNTHRVYVFKMNEGINGAPSSSAAVKPNPFAQPPRTVCICPLCTCSEQNNSVVSVQNGESSGEGVLAAIDLYVWCDYKQSKFETESMPVARGMSSENQRLTIVAMLAVMTCCT